MGNLRPTLAGIIGAGLLAIAMGPGTARAQSNGFFAGGMARPSGYQAPSYNTTYAPSSAYGTTFTAANYFGHRLYGPAGGYGGRSVGGYATGGYTRPMVGGYATGGYASSPVGGYATGGISSGPGPYGGYATGSRAFGGYATGGAYSRLNSYGGPATGARAFGGYATGGNPLVGRTYGGYSTGGSLLGSGAAYGGTASYYGSMFSGRGSVPAAPAGGYPRAMTSLGGALPH